jgi:hypothetical protein
MIVRRQPQPADHTKRNTRLRVCRRSALLALSPALLGLSACGAAKHSSDAARNAICQPASRQLIAQNISVTPAQVSQRRSTANTYPQCSFQAKLRSGARFRALVNVQTGPQLYFLMERTAVEDAQMNFTGKQLYPPPLNIAGLGLLADWFPQYPYLKTTDGFRLLTVTVIWPHHSQRSERQLAIAIARPYLHTPHGKLAERIAQGYPG